MDSYSAVSDRRDDLPYGLGPHITNGINTLQVGFGTFIGHNVTTFVMLCVAPLNLLKSSVVSVLTLLLYKRVARPLFGKTY